MEVKVDAALLSRLHRRAKAACDRRQESADLRVTADWLRCAAKRRGRASRKRGL
ncbi:unnamed protein product [Symbiodinium sp. CCMP2592]|nr:unnamed protein product [Symbiodinium sp. CCMP2592]